MWARKERHKRTDVRVGWRLNLRSRLPRKLHALVARRVRLHLGEVEHHRERRPCLADGLPHEPVRRQFRDERRYVGSLDRFDGTLAESREDAPEIDAVRRGCSFGDVDT
jgi:hypothetical protein